MSKAHDFLGFVDFGRSVVGDILNYKNQKEEQAYQRQLQERIFDREDSAMQRGVADAMKAGLSPLSAVGAGSGTVATSVTPQLDDNARASEAAQFMLNMQAARQQIATGRSEENYYAKLANKLEDENKWNNFWNTRYDDLGITPNSTMQERVIATVLEGLAKGRSSSNAVENAYSAVEGLTTKVKDMAEEKTDPESLTVGGKAVRGLAQAGVAASKNVNPADTRDNRIDNSVLYKVVHDDRPMYAKARELYGMFAGKDNGYYSHIDGYYVDEKEGTISFSVRTEHGSQRIGTYKLNDRQREIFGIK